MGYQAFRGFIAKAAAVKELAADLKVTVKLGAAKGQAERVIDSVTKEYCLVIHLASLL